MANTDMRPNTELNIEFQIISAKEEETNTNDLLRWGQGGQLIDEGRAKGKGQ